MIPKRSDIPETDCWNLESLYTSDAAWDKDLVELATYESRLSSFQGRIGESADILHDFLKTNVSCGLLEERLGYYAMLKQSEDAGYAKNQERYGRYLQVSAKIDAASSFFTPELLAIPVEVLDDWIKTKKPAEFAIALNKILKFRKYTLGATEERLLALQAESNQTATRTFGALLDVDMDFGEIETPEGVRPLTQSTFGSLLEHPDRSVRNRTFEGFYSRIEAHKNTLSALYNGSIQLDVYKAKVRGYGSAREMRLFPDNVPLKLYDNLVETVRRNLGLLHRYYALRAKALKIEPVAVYDMKVPLVPEITVNIPYEESVETVLTALKPLGSEYVSILREGLLGAWVDRYENAGKRSGAFSAGSYTGYPYILLNYKPDILRDTFTLAHEAGHSMHSWYSVRNNPFQHYNYTIFEAEVASTFNEQLLLHHLLQTEQDKKMRTYLLNKSLDDMIGTLFRQTMFAEYEKDLHELVESGEALTTERFRIAYRNLLEAYFGPDVAIPESADLEGLRIPHFYRAFYVYKYATGIAAAISLSERVLHGSGENRERYFAFLRSGGSRYPLESLREAGVDLSGPEPIEEAMSLFSRRLDELERSIPL